MKRIFGIFLAAILIVLTACGEVITPQPTTEIALPASTSHPIATATLPPRLTATALLLPPATTATPTITPTPILHVVQAGEALYTIALAYGVNVEALQNANGVTDPQSLQPGQQLIIPTGEEATETTFGVLLPTSTPLPFEKRGVAFYETPVGSLLGLGEVVNTTDFDITNVQVRVTLFDAADTLLTVADAFVDADLIPPGERSPFRILFTAPPSTWASYEVTIIRGDAAGPLMDSYVPIAVTEVEGGLSGSQFQVRGIVQNTSDGWGAKNVRVILTTYDAQGVVTGSRQNKVEVGGTLAPGATAPFDSLFTFYGDVPADFHVIALGRVSTE